MAYSSSTASCFVDLSDLLTEVLKRDIEINEALKEAPLRNNEGHAQSAGCHFAMLQAVCNQT